MNTKEFYKEYLKAETWGQANTLLKQLNEKQLKEFIKTHETVKQYTGLDMRQSFYLTSAKVILEYLPAQKIINKVKEQYGRD